MPLPKPGLLARPGARVTRIPEAEPTGRETTGSIAAAAQQVLPDLPLPALEEPAEETISPAFQRRGGSPATEDPFPPPPWDESPNLPVEQLAEELVVEPEYRAIIMQDPAPELQAPAIIPPRPQTAVSAVVEAPRGSVEQRLAELGFEGLDLGSGFGAFPTVVLKDDRFSTSDGDQLGQGFLCVIHHSKPKWIVKANDHDKKAEYKYSRDKVNDTSGVPLSTSFEEWRRKGAMKGDPVWKPYLDATAQLVDVTKRELGQVVILQIPQTSIEKLKGYLTQLALQGRMPSEVITQVGLGQKVTSVDYPFWPWNFRKWGDLSKLDL